MEGFGPDVTGGIAGAMNLSPERVHKHRQNIRRKCGISHKKIDLTSYLSS